MKPLPIDAHLPEIGRLVKQHPIIIVEAPPGTGKTTRVAPSLMQLPPFVDRQIYLLQPRRLAAKSVAQRIAMEQEQAIGSRIGYQVRFDSQVSAKTQLIVATEGILIRKLQFDPTLDGVGIVLLDEFHERSLDADLLLGMLRRVQTSVREDMRIVIMSATIEAKLLQMQLGNAPIVAVTSVQHPVKMQYRPMPPKRRVDEQMVEVLGEAVQTNEGDILAFLPGAGEIRKCAELLDRKTFALDVDIIQLYGAMDLAEQSRAIETGKRRRIVLATNIAETSLTIEGVRVVVDAGLARVMRYSPEVGLDRLSLEPICQASATQRAGRAGRVAPGVCYRLWHEASDRSRSAFLEPEIRRTDIVAAVLQLYAWGEGESIDFPWLEPPRAESLTQSRSVLEMLGAIADGKVTRIGKALASLPTHPRLGRMILRGEELGCLDRVCMLAAMLSDRDPFDRHSEITRSVKGMATRSSQSWDSDCIERLVAIERCLRTGDTESPFGVLHRSGVSALKQSSEQLRHAFQVTADRNNPTDDFPSSRVLSDSDARVMQSLVAGYADRLAKRREAGKPSGLMVGGKGVTISAQSGVRDAELFLCVDIEGSSGDAIVRQASKVELEWLPEIGLTEREELFFHPSQKQVVARRRRMFFDLVLGETPTTISDAEACGSTLLEAAKKQWEQAFPKDDANVVGWVERVECLREWLPELELPRIDDVFLHRVASELCRTRRSFSDLRSAPWLDWMRSELTQEQLQAIEREAPPRIMVPSGSWIRIRYERGKPPTLSVKIQEMFSCKATPKIAKGRIPLLLELLSPSMRPQQLTTDLASFWANGYPVIKRELKRRYPKHSWPDDPTTAAPGKR